MFFNSLFSSWFFGGVLAGRKLGWENNEQAERTEYSCPKVLSQKTRCYTG
jgi:hypothetical protein